MILLVFIPRDAEKEYSIVSEMLELDDQGKKME
jgi:hypothetical protein